MRDVKVIMVGVATLLALSGCQETTSEAVEPTVFVVEVENLSASGAFTATNGSTHDIGLSPGLWVRHDDSFQLFELGEALSRPELESLGELGDPRPLLETLDVRPLPEGVHAVGVFGGTLGGNYADLQLGPGAVKTLITSAQPGERLSLVFMLGMSNDTVVATLPEGLELFDASGALREGDLSAELALYDLGTEVNEDLAIGQHQPSQGGGIDDGEAEGGVVSEADTTQGYPELSGVVRLAIQPR